VKVGYVTESAAKKEEREKLGKRDALDEDGITSPNPCLCS
jgi:hypothetical protein